jgi:hypothetical protein
MGLDLLRSNADTMPEVVDKLRSMSETKRNDVKRLKSMIIN